MDKSSRVHARFGGGGGGGDVEARRPENSLDNVFLVLNYFTVFRGDPIFSKRGGGGGEQLLPGAGPNAFYRNPYNLWFSRAESGPPIPLWIRTWGRLTPLFVYRIMVYQNLNKNEKCHPTMTKRK